MVIFMLYDIYQKRIQKIAGVMSKIVRMLPLIIPVLSVIVITLVTLMATKGIVGELECVSEITYGESFECDASAFMSSVRYEYSPYGEDDWSEDFPKLPGKYEVRAVGKTTFGGNRYGKSKTFTILPKEITVSVLEESITYGEEIHLNADLAFNDTIHCEGFEYSSKEIKYSSSGNGLSDSAANFYVEITKITPKSDEIKIFDKKGNDVTKSYTIKTETTQLVINKREIGITVEDKYYTYDGQQHYYNIYAINSGTLKAGDELVATFTKSLTDVGQVINVPTLRIFNENKEDVTKYYKINKTIGFLGVDKRPLIISTGSIETEYSDKDIVCHEYFVDPSTTLADGHYIVGTNAFSSKSPGVYENVLELHIVDANGNYVDDNYAITYIYGTITINKKPVTITTGSSQWIYDGESHRNSDFSAEGLIEGHRLAQYPYFTLSEWPSIQDVGIAENKNRAIILDKIGNDVTDCYEVEYIYGTVEILPRPITITTPSASLVYDGSFQGVSGVKFDGIVSYHYIVELNCPSIRDVGSIENVYSIAIYDREDNVVTSNYSITYIYGFIEITRRPVTVRTGNISWVYDDTPHTNPTYTVESEYGIVDSEVFEASYWESVLNVEKKENICRGYCVYRYDDETNTKVDVTDNYDLTVLFGTIEILPRPIVVKPMDEVKVYDGTPLYPKAIELSKSSKYNVIKGHVFTADMHGSRINVGTSPSYLTDPCVTKGEENITYNYIISLEEGALTVVERPITVLTGSAEKYYDRTPLICKDYLIAPNSPYGLVGGHQLFVKTTGSQTAIGESENICDEEYTYILDSGEDVTYNYKISYIYGILTVKPHAILYITSASDSKYYDRTPLTNANYELSIQEGKINTSLGHSLIVSVFGSITEIGIAPNKMTAKVVDRYGDDVSDYYTIKLFEGTLEIVPRRILIETGSAEKYYDGKPLTCKEFSISMNSPCELLDGDRLIVKITGTQTEVGESDNTCDEKYTHVVDSSYKTVGYYEFLYDYGTLVVKEENKPDPEPPTPPDPPDKDIFGKIKTNKTGKIYLRQLSYGLYLGNSWSEVTPYGKTLPGGYSYNYLASFALKNSGAKAYTAEFKELMLYMLPYYLGFEGSYEIQDLDTVYSGKMTDFLVYYYEMAGVNGYDSLKGNLGEYAELEKEYREYVYLMYLSLDNETRAYMDGIIKDQGFDISDPQVIGKVAEYIQHAAKYNLGYNRSLDQESNMGVAFLDKYKEGICVHYATAATLLYRALGIPARYTEGFMISTVEGEFVDIKNPGHAWVEVYVDGLGWVPVEVTGGAYAPSPGEDEEKEEEPKKETIKIKPTYQWKIYDGLALIADPSMIDICSVLESLISDGYTYTVEVSGSQKEIGVGSSKIEKFILFDPNGVDVTDKYEVIAEDGILEIIPPTISVIRVYLYKIQKYYDGTSLSFEKDDYEIIEMEEGLRLELSFKNALSVTNVDSILLAEINSSLSKYVSYRVYKNGIDVTAGYKLIFEKLDSNDSSYVPIRVDKRKIVITSASDTKVYDGTELRNDTVYISLGSLVSGHTLKVEFVGGNVDEGEYQNEFYSVRIYDEKGRDVTDNYDIESVYGILTILPPDD